MAKKGKRICYICGKEYEYCHRCSKDPTWKYVFCDENCKHISKILDDYVAGIITANAANDVLKTLDLSGYSNFHQFAKDEIEDIKANLKPKTTKDKDDAKEVKTDNVENKKPKKVSPSYSE